MDFSKRIDRKKTNSIKWDKYTDKDIIGCGTADMDFTSSVDVKNALIKRAEIGIFGYEYKSENYFQSIINWNKKLYDWEVKKEWISNSPGIWAGIRIAIDTFSQPEDLILSHSPTFHPIDEIIQQSKRKAVKSNLRIQGNKYEIDFEDFEHKLRLGVKIFVLVNPHNPTGRVFSRQELIRIGELCKKYNVLVLSDEVYGPLAFKEFEHTPFSSLSDFSNFSITFNAVSKPFNLQGLTHAILIIPNKELYTKYSTALSGYDFDFATNVFSLVGVEAAYTYGWDWLQELKNQLKYNIDYCETFVAENLPKLKVFKPEGLFLVWIDFSQLHLDYEQLEELFISKSKLAPTFGKVFGNEYSNFVRLNFGCSSERWEEILVRLQKGINAIEDI
ncbi:MalY/PatB family protein [Flammeovirga kamogawensis]|uniref:cysteine-S-conjugate beta-lyase n=1 Tax=Flammeovirga kamogawensis TaxID=373891 RepID=A0ABX8H530_9BACT|nr:PatB family C-S lyase [Flammeovirga kamogawensis]MBB6461843.1 cystathionine beta-lyase [Flammeovirga kamogawensis]QWG10542.1 PatB family C-S lyase [Flammeovirga kamogawensis]TRX63650.1 putative C-S lyase [Flammeovirga kamogawensis]